MNLLKLRRKMNKKKPKFLRQEWFRLVSLENKWRKPRGRHSKLRKHIKGKGSIPKTGYGSPKAVRGLHPCGLKEVLIINLKQVGMIDAKKECVRIGRTIGIRKRIEIVKIAKEKGTKILNPQRITKPEKKKVEKPKEEKEETKKEEKKEKEKPSEKKESKTEEKPTKKE